MSEDVCSTGLRSSAGGLPWSQRDQDGPFVSVPGIGTDCFELVLRTPAHGARLPSGRGPERGGCEDVEQPAEDLHFVGVEAGARAALEGPFEPLRGGYEYFSVVRHEPRVGGETVGVQASRRMPLLSG